jgi:hypothetical protein
LPIRPFRQSGSAQIVEIGRALYANYFGHYHADPMFDRAKILAYVDLMHFDLAGRGIDTHPAHPNLLAPPVGVISKPIYGSLQARLPVDLRLPIQ